MGAGRAPTGSLFAPCHFSGDGLVRCSHRDIFPHLLLTPHKASLVLSSHAAAWLGFFLPVLRGPPPTLCTCSRPYAWARLGTQTPGAQMLLFHAFNYRF